MMGEILSSGGGLSLMESHATSFACPLFTFSETSTQKCVMALVDIAERWGPQSTASCISVGAQGRPVRVGQP